MDTTGKPQFSGRKRYAHFGGEIYLTVVHHYESCGLTEFRQVLEQYCSILCTTCSAYSQFLLEGKKSTRIIVLKFGDIPPIEKVQIYF